MKVIILAAGIGSRLRPLTDSVPKCMVPVAGKPILGHQLEAFRASGLTDVVIVVGYQLQQVESYIGKEWASNGVSLIYNNDYAKTNNMYSLYLARDHCEGGCIIVNGDVVFHPEIVSDLLTSKYDNAIPVDEQVYNLESMKISLDNQGKINHISKAITKADAWGASIDVYKFSKAGAAVLLTQVADIVVSQNKKTDWTELAIDQIFDKVEMYPVPTANRYWIEIDNQDDLLAAERLVSNYA